MAWSTVERGGPRHPHLVGETVHGDPDGGQSLLNPYVATSFRWSASGSLKTVEIEEQRVSSEFAGRGRGEHYRKVFRLDGAIDADQWSDLATLWFRGNQLVPEYLAGLSSAAPTR